MAQYTLLLLEATGIQDYIFGSNELAQNIGASELVTQATSLWVFQTLDALGLRHNVPNHNGEYVIDKDIGHYKIADRSITDKLDTEVIYANGGNALMLFAKDAQAKEFTTLLTRKVLLEAPGLQIVCAREEVDWENKVLRDKYQDLRRTLARRKGARSFSTPLVGLGATAACAFTGLPAVAQDDEDHLISATVKGKLDAQEAGLERLHQVLPEARAKKFGFVYDFDLFGKKGESSFIAVIHTDGNSMGNRIEEHGAPYSTPNTNAAYAQALREFSKTVNVAATNALRATLSMLISSCDAQDKFGGVVPLPKPKGHSQLPFRPIVFGGDDVTFVCEGRLGLALAAKYLKEFAQQKLADKKPAHARAGIAVVKSHFPFSRAYELAGDLCASARDYIRKRRTEHQEENLTAMDWHLAISGLVRGITEIRQREYTASEGNLYMRPYRLTDGNKDKPHAWDSFLYVANEFRRPDGGWADKRNKVKALRDALRGGSAATQQFRLNYGIDALPAIPDRSQMMLQGWQGGECGYFDVIEALDMFVPLEGSGTP